MMKIIKIFLGTVFGLMTICYITLFVQSLIRFIHVWATTGYSPQGLSETGASLAAVCLGVAFTTWAFRSAFRKQMPRQENNDSKD
ncbi:MAG: hypothetical protein KKE86_07930 [Planctomycetes bacterium]|nr:hypothetical protein [Planctomycetota bacterium]MBU4399247.1 hypothetical protein [Planctomycetota bacterium]MCG2684703.1 hypothetical protein [Planctomycetales bacterium]